MAIPDYQTLMGPVLRALEDGQAHAVKDIAAALAAEFGLSHAELNERLPSGTTSVWRNRVSWATQYLYQAGAIARTKRGVFMITDRGRKVLAENGERVDNADLEQFVEFRDFRARGRVGSGAVSTANPTARGPVVVSATEAQATPHDRIAEAAEEANAAVAAELLTRINDQPPEFLERIVLDLLVAMGYAGAMGGPEHLGRSGDEGVDGVLNQDALGLDRIYVQAKRYSSGRHVGRPEIQAFVGALHGAQASRGVFITTSRFSDEARQYTRLVPQTVILIDGTELTSLMVRYGVGVQTEQTFTLMKVDEDFFE